MASNRIGRINEEIQRELSGLLRTVKDPRVADAMLTITHVDTTCAMSWARSCSCAIRRSCNSSPMIPSPTEPTFWTCCTT